MFENRMKCPYGYILCMIWNGNSSSSVRMIENIMASCCVIEEKAMFFQNLDELTRSESGYLRHVTFFLLLDVASPVPRK